MGALRTVIRPLLLVLAAALLERSVLAAGPPGVHARGRQSHQGGPRQVRPQTGAPAEGLDAYSLALAQAVRSYNQGRYDQAVSEARKAADLAPQRYEAPFYVGLGLYRQDNLAEALHALMLAEEKAPHDRRRLAQAAQRTVLDKMAFWQFVRAGDKAVGAGNYPRAASAYGEAWRLFPMRADAGIAYADCLARAGQPLAAATALQAIIGSTGVPATRELAARLLASTQQGLPAERRPDDAP
jgi:tetratricopeptide (TPR) repeat protein